MLFWLFIMGISYDTGKILVPNGSSAKFTEGDRGSPIYTRQRKEGYLNSIKEGAEVSLTWNYLNSIKEGAEVSLTWDFLNSIEEGAEVSLTWDYLNSIKEGAEVSLLYCDNLWGE